MSRCLLLVGGATHFKDALFDVQRGGLSFHSHLLPLADGAQLRGVLLGSHGSAYDLCGGFFCVELIFPFPQARVPVWD